MAKINILVVDDQEVIRELFIRTLGLKGYKVATAKDGPSAIEAVQKTEYGLIFMDVVMPGMDGLEVFKKVKKVALDTPIVTMMTGFAVQEKLDEAKKLGAYKSLHKPFDIAEIMEVIKKVENIKRVEKEK